MRLLKTLPRFQRAYAALEHLAARESWRRDELQAFQLERLNRVWRTATGGSPFYAELKRDRRLPDSFSSLDEFTQTAPILERDVLRRRATDLLVRPTPRGSWRFTGGSTGEPTRIYWPQAAHRRNLQTRYRCQQQWGVDFLEPQAMLWGHAASFAPGMRGRLAKWIQPLIDQLRGRVRLSAYQLGPQDLLRYLEQVSASGSTMLYGYSTAVLMLARSASELRTHCNDLRLIILTGEPAFDWLKDEVEAGLQAPAVVEYGSVDCGVMATEHSDRTLRVRADAVFLETVERVDGCYDIVVTSLINDGFPLLRYRIGDLTDVALESPAAGFPILSQVTGRQNDLLRSRTGRLVHSLSVKHTFEYSECIRRFQARQDESGALRVLVETPHRPSGLDIDNAARRLQTLLEGFPVSIEEVESLPRSPAGKHRWVISELVQPS